MSGSKYTLAGNGLSIGADLIIAVLPRGGHSKFEAVEKLSRIELFKGRVRRTTRLGH
jgi:hypothetical protein